MHFCYRMEKISVFLTPSPNNRNRKKVGCFHVLAIVNRHFPFLGESFCGWILLDSPFSETAYWGSFVVVVWLLSCVWPFCNSMDCRLPGSSVYGIFQVGIMELVDISFSKEFSWARDLTQISCIGRQILYHWASREAHRGSLLGLMCNQAILPFRPQQRSLLGPTSFLNLHFPLRGVFWRTQLGSSSSHIAMTTR